jgi:hypothetical protein
MMNPSSLQRKSVIFSITSFIGLAQGWKGLLGVNKLPYFASMPVMKKKESVIRTTCVIGIKLIYLATHALAK